MSKDKKTCYGLVCFGPACGDGSLLKAAIYLMKKAGVKDISSRIMGVDIDPEMIRKAKSNLASELECSEDSLNLLEGDFFKMIELRLFKDSPIHAFPFNIILSNPPYGSLREYEFFEKSYSISHPNVELIFLIPLAFIDRVEGPRYDVLEGRPMGVTTGHAIAHLYSHEGFTIKKTRGLQSNNTKFTVLTGVKLYEVGGGVPPQTKEMVSKKPFSSNTFKDGWLPCVRTGDIKPFEVRLGRLWVNYGAHLAHPKTIERFRGPRIFVRRMPVWATRQLGAAYIADTALCAGDVLVVQHKEDNIQLLKGLCSFLNSQLAAELLFERRPSLLHRVSYPKIAAKDLNALLEFNAPTEEDLYTMGS